MLNAVTATYIGDDKFLMDEKLGIAKGEKVVITVLHEPSNAKLQDGTKKNLDEIIGSAGALFGSEAATEEYIRKVRCGEPF